MFALVKVHVGNARVKAKGVMAAAEGPEMDIVNFLHALNFEEGTRNVFHAQIQRAARPSRRFAAKIRARCRCWTTTRANRWRAEERIDPARAGRE